MAMANSTLLNGQEDSEAWIFRDDVGAPHGIKGMKSRSTPLVCTMVTITGHQRSLGVLTTQLPSEEVSRSSREPVKVAMEPCIKSMIFWSTRVSSNRSSSKR